MEPEDGDIIDRDVEVEFDDSIGRPADAVEEEEDQRVALLGRLQRELDAGSSG